MNEQSTTPSSGASNSNGSSPGVVDSGTAPVSNAGKSEDANPFAKTAAEAGIVADSKGGESNPKGDSKERPAAERKDEPAKAKSFFGKLVDRVAGSRPACTCGKLPGTNGRHKASCAIEQGRSGHFAAPILSAPKVDSGNVAPLVSPVAPVAPADYSFYGKAGETFVRGRLWFEGFRVEKKCTPVVGEKEALGFKSDVISAVKEESIEEFKNDLIAAAKENGWQAINPLWKAGLSYASIEGQLWAAHSRIDSRLSELIELKKQELALKKAA